MDLPKFIYVHVDNQRGDGMVALSAAKRVVRRMPELQETGFLEIPALRVQSHFQGNPLPSVRRNFLFVTYRIESRLLFSWTIHLNFSRGLCGGIRLWVGRAYGLFDLRSPIINLAKF